MKNKKSTYLIVAISLVVGLLHVVFGPDYSGIFRHFIRGYLMDILVPMNVYLLLQLSLRNHMPVKKAMLAGALVTFLIGTATEILQFYGFRIFGNTFDPLDMVMYGIGIGLGLIIDATIIKSLEHRSKQNAPSQ